MPKLACYGTLKTGQYNHMLISGARDVNVTPLASGTIKGVIGIEPGASYPVASTDGDGQVLVEIHEVSVKAAAVIAEMESAYGYYPEAVELCGHIAVMWCRQPSNEATILKDGVF